MEGFMTLLVFFIFVGTVVLCVAGLKANGGSSFWATKCLGFTGVVNAFLGFGLFALVLDEFSGESLWIAWAILSFLSGLVFLIGMFALCGRFGATCRRVTQLEEIASALEASQAHSAQKVGEGRTEN